MARRIVRGSGVFVGATGILLLAAAPAIADSTADPNNIVVNSNFATPAQSAIFTDLGAGSTAITGWRVASGTVDLCKDSLFAPPAGDPSTAQTVDLSGTDAGSITQVLPTTAGFTYTGSFELAGNFSNVPEPKTGTLTVGATTVPFSFDATGKTGTNMGWQQVTFSFTATSSSTPMTFTSGSNSNAGPVITDVIVDPPVVGAPAGDAEVAVIAAVSVGGAALVAWFVRRRRARPAG